MNPVSTDETASAAPPASRRRLALTTVLRLAAAGVVVAAGVWTVARVRGILHDPEPVAVETDSPSSPSQTRPPVFDTLAAAVNGGRWEFVDGKRTLGFGTLSSADLPKFWDRPLPTTMPGGERDALEKSLLDLIPRLRLTGRHEGDLFVYRWDLPNVKAHLVTSAADATSRLISGRAALLVDSDRWATLETKFDDGANNPKSNEAGGRRLVDYPPGTELLAVRYGPGEQVVGEFSQSPGRIIDLAELWRSAGSEVGLQETPGKPDFRDGYCRRGGRLLRVVMWEPPTGGVTVLVLDPAAAGDVPATR